jgi:hypothetical protein
MDKRKFRTVTAGAAILTVLILILLLTNTLRRSSHIVLPASASSASEESDGSQVKNRNLVDITPQTVQTAISTLKRPSRYIRSLTVRNYWSGGSSTATIATYVCDHYTRSDTDSGTGRIRHMITDGATTYVWYNQSRNYFAGAAGKISADQEQSIPTYEDILKLRSSQILNADYRTFSDENCIYVETAKDADGYVQEYWVSVGTGLLVGAEKLKDGETVYKMLAKAVSGTAPTTDKFTLPDGKVLHQVEK